HDRFLGITPHAVGSHDVTSAPIVQLDALAIDFLFEQRRVDGLDRRAVLCPHLPEEKILQLFRSDNSALGIRRETVGDLRPWQPQAVFEIRERDAIVGIGSLLDQEADSKLPGDSLVQLIDEVLTEHSHSGVAIGIGAAAVDAVDEINSRYVGIATKATSHNEVPALV